MKLLKFKDFVSLLEGGNIKANGHEATPIDIKHKDTPRNQVQTDVSDSLHAIHKHMHDNYGIHLFGKNAVALKKGTAYSGSTAHLMNSKISDAEHLRHKRHIGDIDVQIPHEHFEHVRNHLTTGKKFGKYTIVGTKKAGAEHHLLMKHENGQIHQFDFEKTEYKNNHPTEFERFSHSSHWEDTKKKIKGAHHKALLNALGGSTHKFSISNGFRQRVEKGEAEKPAVRDVKKITHHIFGKNADHKKSDSFVGLVDHMKNHLHPDKQKEIASSFIKASEKRKNPGYKEAIAHMQSVLGKHITEETDEEHHHTSIVPLVGFSPISHMGHVKDLGNVLKKAPGTKHLGMSSKADYFSPTERKAILAKQLNNKSITTHLHKTAGETVGKAWNDVKNKRGKKHLHIIVGADRKAFGEGLKKSIEAGKIPEMAGGKFDHVHIHTPEDENRSHGLSGTKMRKAANESDLDTFHNHIGSSFSKAEAKRLMDKTKAGIDSGSIKLKR